MVNTPALDKPDYKIFLGTKFVLYWDKNKEVLVLETKDPQQEGGPYSFEIPISAVYQFLSVKWDKSKGETFEDVKVKKPVKKKLYKDGVYY